MLNANACKKCECNNHAHNCTYSLKLDLDPMDRTVAGGGVCLDCKHNTRGRYCEQCKPLYYRPSDKLLTAIDVCQPCNCFGPGVQDEKYECGKVIGNIFFFGDNSSLSRSRLSYDNTFSILSKSSNFPKLSSFVFCILHSIGAQEPLKTRKG